MSTKIKPGDKAINFTLPDIDMNLRNLKDFLGTGQKVVLAFSINEFTSRCTKEICEFRDFMYKLINLKAQVIGISVNDPFTNADFVEKNRLCFPVLWDYKRQVFRNYGLCGKKNGEYDDCPYPLRSIFILDTNGTVNYLWVSDNRAAEPEYQEIQRVINETDQSRAVLTRD